MRFRRHTYSICTNTCLLAGVASAFGFDRTDHLAWLGLGGCAATGAIVIYFVQHWQEKSDVDFTSRDSLPTNFLMVDSWTMPMQTRIYPTLIASTELSRRGAYRKTKEWGSEDKWSALSHHAVPEPLDSVKLVSRIVRDLQQTGERRVCEIVISPDSSVTLRFEDGDNQARPHRFSIPTSIGLPETVQ